MPQFIRPSSLPTQPRHTIRFRYPATDFILLPSYAIPIAILLSSKHEKTETSALALLKVATEATTHLG